MNPKERDKGATGTLVIHHLFSLSRKTEQRKSSELKMNSCYAFIRGSRCLVDCYRKSHFSTIQDFQERQSKISLSILLDFNFDTDNYTISQPKKDFIEWVCLQALVTAAVSWIQLALIWRCTTIRIFGPIIVLWTPHWLTLIAGWVYEWPVVKFMSIYS